METELYHHGILGMKWGVRRFQNKDGSLTEAGKKRASDLADKINKYQQKSSDNERKNQELLKKYEIEKAKKGLNISSYYIGQINSNDDLSKYYRDKSKRLIATATKLDPKLGKKLSNNYSDMLNKLYVGDFTVSELRKISKNPEKLEGNAKKFIEQQFSSARASKRLNDIHLALQSSQLQQRQQEQIQLQINQQIQEQIQLQINQQIHQQLLMNQYHGMF